MFLMKKTHAKAAPVLRSHESAYTIRRTLSRW
nr:MAG TPA: hypothetical protein [Caudoviricetes sp.]